ncbi:unnamed protein product [Symbiodinium necroappetens]|uniref:Uncharacterized protein n=1 Tax=Symbiodinium necroappetens TaxID=1628268 RepID=A0A812L6C6_9DINO|nr:unnamed protein product [Symbiodinium necroappetens]
MCVWLILLSAAAAADDFAAVAATDFDVPGCAVTGASVLQHRAHTSSTAKAAPECGRASLLSRGTVGRGGGGLDASSGNIDYMHGSFTDYKSFQSSRVPLNCPWNHALLNDFHEGKVYQQCCPLSSLACAGCERYDPSTDSCLQCAAGFHPFVPSEPAASNQTICQLCTDVAWADADGSNCAAFETSGMCSLGRVPNALNLTVNKGLLATEACCACGGGARGASPFAYPALNVPCGKSAVALLPVPRLDAAYLTEQCLVHQVNLTMDGRTGKVFGDLNSPEPQTITCQITTKKARPGDVITPRASANLQIRVVHFACSASALTFTEPNQSFTPAFQGSFGEFELRCTPDLPWAQIDHFGTISQNGNSPLPRTAGCTVSAKGCLDGAGGNCTVVTRSTETVLVAANEPTELFLVSEELSLVVGRATRNIRLSSVLNAQEESEIDPPVAYHVECGQGTRFDARRGVLTKDGLEVQGEPSAALLKHCHASQSRCQIRLACRAYAVLPFSKKLLRADFRVSVMDNTCWTRGQLDRGFEERFKQDYFAPLPALKILSNQTLDANASNATVARCRGLCGADKTCAAAGVDLAGNCYKAVHAGRPSASNLTSVHVKVTDCDPLKQCLMIAVPGEAYLSGQFCPVENHMQLPVYSKDGATDASTLYLGPCWIQFVL